MKKHNYSKAPMGDMYEPGKQVKKAKMKGVASTEKVVENVVGSKYKKKALY